MLNLHSTSEYYQVNNHYLFFVSENFFSSLTFLIFQGQNLSNIKMKNAVDQSKFEYISIQNKKSTKQYAELNAAATVSMTANIVNQWKPGTIVFSWYIQSNNKNTVREFLMTPESINSGRNNNLPAPASLNNIDFEIKGQLDSTSFQMDQPLTGQSKYKLSTHHLGINKK